MGCIRNTLTGEKGLGGIETRGVLRTGMPFNAARMPMNKDDRISLLMFNKAYFCLLNMGKIFYQQRYIILRIIVRLMIINVRKM